MSEVAEATSCDGVELQQVQQILDTAINKMKALEKISESARVPYKELNDAITELESHCSNLSLTIGTLIGEIKTLALSAVSNHRICTRQINTWCGKASDLLQIYLDLSKDHPYDADSVQIQRKTLAKVLADGMQEMGQALQKFEASFFSFDQATGKLATLESALGNEINGKVKWKTILEGFVKIGAFAKSVGFLRSIVTIHNGLMIAVLACAVIGGVYDTFYRINNLGEMFEILAKNVKTSKLEIAHIKALCDDEMEIIGELNAQTNKVDFLLSSEILHNKAIPAIESLIELCNQYRENHKNHKNKIFI